MKSQWACKKCRGKFPTMAEFKYHTCVQKKMEKPVVKRKRRSLSDIRT